MSSQPPIIVDSGTGYLKIGFAGDNFPRQSFPAMVGRPMLRADEQFEGIQLKDIMIGDEAAPCRGLLELSHPLEEGIIKNWDDMELIWEYGFKKITNDVKGANVLMTEANMNPRSNRDKMAQIKFEKFGIGGLQIGIQALLPLFAEGLQTALLLDAGDGVSHCIPVVEGYIIPHSAMRLNIAGRHVTNQLVKLLFMRGYAFNSSADFEAIREVKEHLCFVSGDLKMERKLARETTCHEKEYKFPDGTKIKLGKERFEAPEILFNPQFAGSEDAGCSQIIFDSIMKSDIDIRAALYDKILISGGTSMFPGFPTRIYNDVVDFFKQRNKKDAANTKIKINVLVRSDPARRKYNVFIGASFLANVMKDRKDYWITKADWDEVGPRCLDKIGGSLQL